MPVTINQAFAEAFHLFCVICVRTAVVVLIFGVLFSLGLVIRAVFRGERIRDSFGGGT